MAERLSWTVRGFAISFNIWGSTLENDRDDWFVDRFNATPDNVRVDLYVNELLSLASNYELQLDVVAPVVDSEQVMTTLERLEEFLRLPFWKERWYLYELWTIVSVLNIAQQEGRVDLCNINEVSPQIFEWVLPGGNAQSPIATIGERPSLIDVWAGRRTYHPGNRLGLEPDLRLSAENPAYHDLLIVENKDRRSVSTRDVSEILERYVGGTCADSVWLIDYEDFPAGTLKLGDRWPDRRISVLSQFKPGHVPDSFGEDVRRVVHNHLNSSQSNSRGVSNASASSALMTVSLSWQSLPKDLDLHAWVSVAGQLEHISYASLGNFEASPYTVLNSDVTTGAGPEVLTANLGNLDEIILAVHNYTAERPLSDSRAVLHVSTGEGQQIHLEVPPVGLGRWWHALKVDKGGGTITIMNHLSDVPPSPLQ